VRHDLIVVGGGPVGASLSRALPGLSVALLADPPPERSLEAGVFDARVYALSPANVAFLARIGCWQALPRERLTPVRAMHVHGDDGRAFLEFDALDGGFAELAWIVEDQALQQALWRDLSRVSVISGAACERLLVEPAQARLVLGDGRALEAKLIVGADGAQSFVRGEAGIGATQSEYGQAALVGNFHCARPHGNVARQWFQANGAVLALLPLPGGQVSMVWSLPREEAGRVAALEPALLASAVEEASHRTLGELAPASETRSYALRRVAARSLVAPRLALAGDAAHVIHPLAGQGLNLGLQDARALAATLSEREPGRDPGDYRLLRRYERSRAEPILAMDGVVHGLFRLQGSRSRVVAGLRNAGLNLTHRLPVLKNILMRRAMS
jgi:ubiquinone biosynthesis UbiH/UbiF/VisC/COQ6 family hydroxylase